MEIVFATQTVRDCLESPERTDQILEHVQTSGDGQSFDRHLVELYLGGTITLETARQSASRPADLERELRFGRLPGGQIPAEDQQGIKEMDGKVELVGRTPKSNPRRN
jgi:Tfp pilus assembly ATPase PilU